MSKPKPIFVAIAQETDGKYYPVFTAQSQASFNAFCEGLPKGKPIRLTAARLTENKLRSVEQNAYYWGVVIKILAEELGYTGTFEKEELHDELRSMFLVKVGKLGNNVVESTTRLDTATYERYLAAIRGWALQFQNIKIPLPNEAEVSDIAGGH